MSDLMMAQMVVAVFGAGFAVGKWGEWSYLRRFIPHRLRGCAWVTSIPQHVMWGGAGFASRYCPTCGRKQYAAVSGTPGQSWAWYDDESPLTEAP